MIARKSASRSLKEGHHEIRCRSGPLTWLCILAVCGTNGRAGFGLRVPSVVKDPGRAVQGTKPCTCACFIVLLLFRGRAARWVLKGKI
jgi:hypothetical protein